MCRVEYLDSKKLLLDEIAERLAKRVRKTPAGVQSLSHILIVAPTREAARHIREALARRLGAVAAPLVRLTAELLGRKRGENGPQEAMAEEVMRLGTLADLLLSLDPAGFSHLFPAARNTCASTMSEAIDIANALLRIWRILSEGPYLMRDVASLAPELLKGDNLDYEVARWNELAVLEERYIQLLHSRSLSLPAENTLELIKSGPVFEGIEEIILPGIVAPPAALIKVLDSAKIPLVAFVHAPQEEADAFDEYGRLVDERYLEDLPIQDAQISKCATPGAEAAAAAETFAAIPETDSQSGIVLAQSELFPELEGAFAQKSIALHNPARSIVASSSLGRLVSQLLALLDAPSFNIFSSFIRQSDVQRMISEKLALDDNGIAEFLVELDKIKAEHLPETVDDLRPYASKTLLGALDILNFAKGSASSIVDTLKRALKEIFAYHILDESRPEDREFAAAAAQISSLFSVFDSLDLPAGAERYLFAKALESATYSLERTDDDAVVLNGWLELPYLPQQELMILGMQEGVVPESVAGHAFVPDSLRTALGITTNAVRTRRDAFMLREALLSRSNDMVRLSFHAKAADRTVLKPSRLLLRTSDDAALASRARWLYADSDAPVAEYHRTLPENWRVVLPIPGSPEDPADGAGALAKITPSDLDAYLKCPFTYFLRTRFGTGVKDSADEMDTAQFGLLCHDALNEWAKCGGGECADPAKIASALAYHLERQVEARFSANPPALVRLQAYSARRRLEAFAKRQAERRADGWHIWKTEFPMQVTYDGVLIKGRADRIDRNENTGELCVVDYKVWRNPTRSSPFDCSSRAVGFAESRQLPTFTLMVCDKPKTHCWSSLQLPLYCAMLEAQGVKEPISACYCILAETEDETDFYDPIRAKDFAPESDKLIRELLRRIKEGIFWPPSPDDIWRYDFEQLFFDSPEQSLWQDWIDDQLRRAPHEVEVCVPGAGDQEPPH